MDNNNPADMSNQDLENDMEQRNNQNVTSGNQENVSKTTAAEGDLISPEDDPSSAISHDTNFSADQEQDFDDLVHRQAEEKHNGTMPDPEEVSNWEDREIDTDKISS